VCRAIHDPKGSRPPCDECLPPLWEENQEAFWVYQLCRDQVIMATDGMGSRPVALNQLAVHEAMRLYGVAHPVDCFEKVVQVSRHELARLARKQENAQ